MADANGALRRAVQLLGKTKRVLRRLGPRLAMWVEGYNRQGRGGIRQEKLAEALAGTWSMTRTRRAPFPSANAIEPDLGSGRRRQS